GRSCHGLVTAVRNGGARRASPVLVSARRNAKSRASSRIRDGTVTRLTAGAEVDVGTVPSAARVDDGTLVVTVGEAHAVAWILGSVEDIEPQRTRRTTMEPQRTRGTQRGTT